MTVSASRRLVMDKDLNKFLGPKKSQFRGTMAQKLLVWFGEFAGLWWSNTNHAAAIVHKPHSHSKIVLPLVSIIKSLYLIFIDNESFFDCNSSHFIRNLTYSPSLSLNFQVCRPLWKRSTVCKASSCRKISCVNSITYHTTNIKCTGLHYTVVISTNHSEHLWQKYFINSD